MQASWNGAVIARSEDIVKVDGNAYFPADSLDPACFQPSSHRSICGWKGEAHYLADRHISAARFTRQPAAECDGWLIVIALAAQPLRTRPGPAFGVP